MLDYYKELEVDRLSSIKEITNNFLRLAILWHPDNTNSNEKDILKKFENLCESHYVLSNYELKSIYNLYGYHKLKSGIYEDIYKKGFFYEENNLNYFNKIYSENNIFSEVFKPENIEYKNFQLNDDYKPIIIKNNIYLQVNITLEQYFNGYYESLVYNRLILDSEQKNHLIIKENILIKVNSETDLNKKFIFQDKGNEYRNSNNSDLIISIKLSDHNDYKIENNDLILTHKINLFDALILKPISFNTWDGRNLIFPLKKNLSEENKIILKNEGLLKNNKRGNLIIILDIIYSKGNNINLDNDKIKKVIQVLKS